MGLHETAAHPLIDAEAAAVDHAGDVARRAIFPGESEMARRMRALDWSATDLGAPERWPEHLRSAVQLCLSSRFPILLWWGPRFSVLYNDAYVPFLGPAKHPRALGRPGEESWGEIWDTIAPMLEHVVATGEATWAEDFEVHIARRLPREEVFVTFSYAPILAADGVRVDGVFCPCVETTERVVGARRLETLRRLGGRSGTRTVEQACRDAVAVLRDNTRDVPFAAIYVLDATDGRAIRCAEVALLGEHALPESFVVGNPAPSVWPLARVLATQRAEAVELRGGRASLVGDAWPDPVRTALVLPLVATGPQAAGLLVVGIGPRRVLDDEYRTFLDLAAGHVGAMLAEARVREDERRHAEALAELDRESRRHVTRVLDSISESCQVLSPDWRVLYLNPIARREYAGAGMDPDAMIGRHLWDDLYPERRDDAFARRMQRAMAERVSVSFENYWGPLDRWYRLRLDPLPGGGLACFTRDITAEKRAEETQRRLQQERDAALARLHLQFERMPIGCIVFDAEHRIVDWNPAAEAIFGHRREDVLGRHGPTLLLAPEARPSLDGILDRLAAGDMAAHSVNENVTRDGRTIVCEWHNTPLRDADGTIIAQLSMTQDITERVHAEEALRTSERALAAELTAMARLQEVSSRLVRAEDGTPLLEEIIDAAITITGAERGVIQLLDADGVGLTLIASRGFDAAFRERFHHLRGERTASTEAVRTGERVVVEDIATSGLYTGAIARDVALVVGVNAVQSTPLVARSGRLVGVLSTHYRERGRPAERHFRVVDLLARQAADWIERTQAEDAVRESEERYRALVSQVRDYAIFSTDVQGVITTWNEGCHHVLGYARDEFVGLDLAALFTPEDRAAGVPRRYRRRIAGGRAVQAERWMLAGGGRRFFAMGVATALRDVAGRPLGASVVLRDVTRMKLAQDALAHRSERLDRLVSERTDALQRATERLRASERMASLGTLAAGLGHDLGNLLVPLEARLQLLERAVLPADLREQVVGIASCVEYLQRLSGGLRLLATDPADTRLTEPTELGAWWTDVGRILKNVLPRHVAFEGSMPATETWVAVGRAGLTQAVFNVVQNAADALRERAAGRVDVHVASGPRPSTVAIDVSDDGPGMTPEVLRRCAEPYFSTKARGVSTGVGLALVRGLVTAAGGELSITSAPGAGTTVRLVLPGAILPERRPPHAAADTSTADPPG